MRVPNLSTYVNSTYRLGLMTGDLENANKVASTTKQLNDISDDPLGLSQVLTINNTLGNIDQTAVNVNMGKSWIRSIEEALGSINDIIVKLNKQDISGLANDSTTAKQRREAIQRVDDTIELIVSLGNTQINGNYIFSGTDTDKAALTYDRVLNKVLYNGNSTAFDVLTDRGSSVTVGRTGDTTFWDQEIEIKSTNDTIVFKQDNGHGDTSERILIARIPQGSYGKSELETVIRNALNEQSASHGYGARYEVDFDEITQKFSIREDGSYDGYIRTEFMWDSGNDAYVYNIQGSSDIDPMDIDVDVVRESALTIRTTDEDGPAPIRLTWDKADKKWRVADNPGYEMPTEFSGTSRGVDIALNDGGVTDIRISFDTPVADGDYIEFEIEPITTDTSVGHDIGFNSGNIVQAPPVSDFQAAFVTDITIGTSGNNTINFIETNAAGLQQTLTANFNTSGAAVTYSDMDALAQAIEQAMESASAAPTSGANTIDYTVSYDAVNSRFNIRENGTDLNELEIQWSATTASAQTLGYHPLDDTISYPHSAITIDNTNNRLDFAESTGGAFTSLQAVIPNGTYETMADLAAAVEAAMESVSAYNYNISYNPALSQFAIQQTGGAALTDFNLLWHTGDGRSSSIGETLGYDPELDDTGAGLGPFNSDTDPMRMSIFSVTIDGTNNMIDFEEVNTAGGSTTLQASIPQGTYTSVHELEDALEQAMNKASEETGNTVVYDVSYDEAGNHFDILRTTAGTALNELKLLWDTGANNQHTIGDILGYDTSLDDTGATSHSSSSGSAPTWLSFDSTNNRIDFREIRIDGTVSNEMNIEIPAGNYNDLNQVAAAIQTEMRAASPNSIPYEVIYDSNDGFMIKGSDSSIKGFDLLWQTGDYSGSNAAQQLGLSGVTDTRVRFSESDEDVVNIVIDGTNNKIDFKEIVAGGQGRAGFLTASIEQKTYTSHDELAQEVEEALEAESRANGNIIDYSVSWDSQTKRFSIKEDGVQLDELQLVWQSGDNAPASEGGSGQTIGTILGFDPDDDIYSPAQSNREVEWGIFNTLIDLKQYLADNDRDGIGKTIGRLDTHYDNTTSLIVDAGMKYNRLVVRENINAQVGFTLKERRSNIEDADMIESIMNLKNIETAYQAALSSTSKVLSLSLVDYLR